MWELLFSAGIWGTSKATVKFLMMNTPLVHGSIWTLLNPGRHPGAGESIFGSAVPLG